MPNETNTILKVLRLNNSVRLTTVFFYKKEKNTKENLRKLPNYIQNADCTMGYLPQNIEIQKNIRKCTEC